MENHANLDSFIGKVINNFRKKQGLTIAEVSEQSNISRGMLSKIENGQVSPSLDSLLRISKTLGVPISAFFKEFDSEGESAQLVRADERLEVVRRGTKVGHTYHLLAYDTGPNKTFEPFLISLDNKSEIFPSFSHEGKVFMYLLEGEMAYRHGKSIYQMKPGDSLTYDASISHGPEDLIQVPIKFLNIIIYGNSDNT
ncbi:MULTISPECIES: helix-turn-helix domain-containing protein [Thiomicrorhabdus]|uniref:Helix-turn-helix domain-containing protein n=1 Tax=Thiomicrorhabdus heinhorstiae TaxID=2748010 RepID=A0ABS0BYQ3_9GAMM|nr:MULTISPECIES: helix-turn-helix domain-containing protein [Thiomicrorhabdus]MBF6057981.1 helix-turn-helix domain-containing protein [Thiomicrorhabdus heinhorstiae]